MKIYTGTGDQGETGLLGGIRVLKNHLAVCVCGELDETNSLIGLVLSEAVSNEVRLILDRVQHDLFVLGSQVAACQSNSKRAAQLESNAIAWLEQSIDQSNSNLPPMDAFILPGGSTSGAWLHVARSVCRRAERSIVALTDSSEWNGDLPSIIVYLNRLSDLLFVLARKVNMESGCTETKWLPKHG